MFKTRDFLPVIITGLIVVILALITLAESHACSDNWSCWAVAPFEILFGRYQPPVGTASTESQFLLILTMVGGKTILLVGAFLSSVRLVISAVRHDFRAALARKMKNHTIVCGLGETGMQVVSTMRSGGQKVVVIDRADDTVNSAACDRQGIPVIRGDATKPEVLNLAGVSNARTIVICTGDDVSNIDAALNIKELEGGRQQLESHDLVVLTEMRTQWLFSRLVNHNQYTLGSGRVDLRLFNTHENAARLLLRSLKLPPGPEIESGAFVIFGFGPLGQQIVLHMIRAAPAKIGSKTRIIVFDRAAEQCQREFSQTFPQAAKLADVSFIEVDVSTKRYTVWSGVENVVRDLPLLGVAVCFEDDQIGLYAGMSMRRLLDDLSRIHVPLFLRLGQYRHLGRFAATLESLPSQPQRFQVFGSLEELLGADILIRGELDELAKQFHAQYRDSREAIGQPYPADKPWNMLPETLKMSNRRRADNLPFLLAQAGLHMEPSSVAVPLELSVEEIELLAQLEHRRWMIERRLLGFSHGDARSDFPPRHELLVEWEQLPEIERERNRKDFANLPKILAPANFQIWREQKILIVASTLQTEVSKLELAVAKQIPRCVVVADVDSDEGRRAAELALQLPKDAALWLLSSNYPLQFQGLQQFREVFERAAGWIKREQIHVA